MEFGLKWVHMARYELILRLDGALRLTIIFRPLLTPKRANNASFGQWEAHYQNPLYQQKARAHMDRQMGGSNFREVPTALSMWPRARTPFLGYFSEGGMRQGVCARKSGTKFLEIFLS